MPKPLRGHFERAGVTPRRHVVELRTLDASSYRWVTEVTAAAFAAGTVVDVIGTSKGKGYAGVMKRHGFNGLGAGTASSKSTARPVRSVPAPPRAVSSRACGWPAAWAASAPRP